MGWVVNMLGSQAIAPQISIPRPLDRPPPPTTPPHQRRRRGMEISVTIPGLEELRQEIKKFPAEKLHVVASGVRISQAQETLMLFSQIEIEVDGKF